MILSETSQENLEGLPKQLETELESLNDTVSIKLIPRPRCTLTQPVHAHP